MAAIQAPQRRQFPDVFTNIASGYAVASPTAITTGSTGSVAISVPGVTVGGFWEALAELTSAATLNVAGVNLYATVTAAGVVTMTIQNNSGGTITPTASSKYVVVLGQLDTKFVV